jgi:putative SOS response-associated peptidase YedK
MFNLDKQPPLAPRYNIAPSQPVAIVRASRDQDNREWALVQWGLVPSWSKDPSIGARMINARAETVEEKPSFRTAFKRRRCLIPADGFYEWKRLNGGKQPFYIRLESGEPFAFGGLWEYWQGPDGSALESCTILTTEPNGLMAELHNRMPLILSAQDYDDWLFAKEGDKQAQAALHHLLRPYPAEEMIASPVSTFVNNPRNEGEACIASITDA